MHGNWTKRFPREHSSPCVSRTSVVVSLMAVRTRSTRVRLKDAAEDDMAAKRASFLAMAVRLRRKTEGRRHTPAEVLIREDRDHGHREL